MSGKLQIHARYTRICQAACSLLVAACAGCAGQDVKVSGPWQPVNALDATPRPISQAPVVQFIATPVDQTLRSLLARWAREGNWALDFRVASDFSLTQDAASIRAPSIESALATLNGIYAGSGVQIELSSGVLVANARADIEPVAKTPGRRKAKRRSSP